MSDFVQEFTESAEKVAKMMDLINRITGKIQPVIININGIPLALTLQPIAQEPVVQEEEVVEEECCGPDCECHKVDEDAPAAEPAQ